MVDGIDRAVESVILRCLDPDPAQRPPSALAVAAALPGGDPLAAALAAGETPSPEMVADAGAAGALSPTRAWAVLALALAGLAGVLLLLQSHDFARLAGADRSPELLRDQARQILRDLGYDGPIGRESEGFETNVGYLNHIADTDKSVGRWDALNNRQPAALRFWYVRKTFRPGMPC